MLRKLAIDPTSNLFQAIEYDVSTGRMVLTFMSGARYECTGVAAEHATALEQPGQSPGKYYHANLKGYTWTPM